eukprot:gene17292-5368_t
MAPPTAGSSIVADDRRSLSQRSLPLPLQSSPQPYINLNEGPDPNDYALLDPYPQPYMDPFTNTNREQVPPQHTRGRRSPQGQVSSSQHAGPHTIDQTSIHEQVPSPQRTIAQSSPPRAKADLPM